MTKLLAALLAALLVTAPASADDAIEDALKSGAYVILPGDQFLDLIDGETPDKPTEPTEPDVTLHDFGEDYDFAVWNAQIAGSQGATWIDSFRKWGVRTLEANGDIVEKRAAPPFTHQLTENGLLLRAGYRDGKPIGGMLSAEDWMAFTRGEVEVRARIGAVPNGYHIAIWMVPSDGGYPPEYDLLEVVHGRNNPSNGKAHFNDHQVGEPSAPISHRPIDGAWHTYRLESSDAGVKWFLDDELVRQTSATIDVPLYLIASWEGGSKWPGPITDKSAVAEIEIDYIRIEDRP